MTDPMYGMIVRQHVQQVATIVMITETIPSKNIIRKNKIAEPRWSLQSVRHAIPIPSTARTLFKYIVGTTKIFKKNENAMHAMIYGMKRKQPKTIAAKEASLNVSV